MDKGFEKERFRTIRVKSSVASKFRRFSGRFGQSRSMTLLLMVQFFECHGISPDQHLGETMASMKHYIRRRFNAMVAIMRSIEKEQTLPTVGMMQALFEQELESDGEEGWDNDFDFIERQLTETKKPSQPEPFDGEVTVPKIRYDRLVEQMEELKQDFTYVLDHVSVFQNRFGKDHLKLDLNPEALEKYRTKLKKP
ncbi:BfmA/BtgA family mobilization protein [Flagellimonas baculiformis]|uniref:BfmA/BtgA family mobilization protein n=1 Tax=Flagellimonas baculiformis TaxID=3067310 RepID=UPI00296EB811|nr:BfmA/BtgA family mobilization protein [Muricauda sp. D6]